MKEDQCRHLMAAVLHQAAKDLKDGDREIRRDAREFWSSSEALAFYMARLRLDGRLRPVGFEEKDGMSSKRLAELQEWLLGEGALDRAKSDPDKANKLMEEYREMMGAVFGVQPEMVMRKAKSEAEEERIRLAGIYGVPPEYFFMEETDEPDEGDDGGEGGE